MHWAHQYIGLKWISGARGPDAFDCWGLLWWVYRAHYDLEVPCYPGINAKDVPKVAHLLSEAVTGTEWHRLPAPLDGCAVAMSRSRIFHHVGIFIDLDGGLILHAVDGANIIAQSIQSLKAGGYNRIEFFQHGAHRRNNQPL